MSGLELLSPLPLGTDAAIKAVLRLCYVSVTGSDLLSSGRACVWRRRAGDVQGAGTAAGRRRATNSKGHKKEGMVTSGV